MVLFEFLSGTITSIIEQIGYVGILFLMALESACIPVPSEMVMPFSGLLSQQGKMDIWLVTLAGSLGCLIGSLIAYFVGYYGGRPLLDKYGKYVLIKNHELDLADRWFQKYGGNIVFIARLLPVIRTFISLPAGIARMNLPKFAVYSFVGSVPWCFALAYAGVILGDNWKLLEEYWIYVDIIMVIGIIFVAAYVIYQMFFRKDTTSGQES